MKRVVGPVFAALLLIASLASATPAPPMSGLSANASEQAPDCAKGALSFMTPEPADKSDYPTCGACSVAVCVGAYDGTVCGMTSTAEFKYCRPTGPLCADGPPADFRCTCTTNIVP